MSVTIIVPGDPQALKRARVGQNRQTGRPRHFDPASNKSAKGEIVFAWHAAGHEPYLRGTPLKLVVSCFFRRPDAHFGTGRNAQRLKDSAPHYVTKTPDCDNLGKLVGDALNGYAWHDDAQIVVMEVVKVFCAPTGQGPHTRIVISALEERGL